MRSKRSTLEATRRFSVVTTLPGDEALTNINYGSFFIANRACTILKISESHTDLSTGGGNEDCQVRKLASGDAPAGGVPCLAGTGIDLTTAINVVQSPALGGAADLVLAAGDRLSLEDDGVLTALEGVCVTVDLQEEVAAAVVRSKVAMYDTRRILLPIHLPDAIAGTALNYGAVFICPADDRYIFVGAEVVYTTKAGAACTLTIERLQGTEAPNNAGAPEGDALLDAAFNLQNDAEVVQYGTVDTVDSGIRTLADGDRIGLLLVGTEGALRNVEVTIELEELLPLRAKQAPTEDERIFVTAVLYGAQPQTTLMMDKFFTASKPCRVVAARCVFTTAVGGACTLQVEKLTGILTQGNGVNLLDGDGFNLNVAATTVQAGTLSAVAGALDLAVGDRLSLAETGALLAAIEGLCVTVELEAIQ